MKTTFDLPDPLMRRAKALAAEQGRPLRDLMAEALTDKLAAVASTRALARSRRGEWNDFKARLRRQSDGTLINPDGIDDPAFFASLDAMRTGGHPWPQRDPFAEDAKHDAGEARGG